MTVNIKNKRVVFINQALDHFETQTYKKPLIIIDNTHATAPYLEGLTSAISVRPHTVVVESLTDRKSLIQSLLNGLISEEYDAIYTFGGQLAFTYGQELIYLLQHLQQAFTFKSYMPGFKSLFILKDDVDYKKLYKRQQYNRVFPDTIYMESDSIEVESITLSIEKALNTLHHGMDQYLFYNMNSRSRQITQECIELIYTHIITAYKRQNIEALTYIKSATYLIELLFDHKSIGLSHKINTVIQSTFDMSSQINYLLLPHTLNFLSQNYDFKRQLSSLACFLTLDFKDDSTNATAFIESLKMMNNALDLPMNISTHGIENKVFLDHIDKLSEAALDDMNSLDYNLKLSIEDIRGILVSIM